MLLRWPIVGLVAIGASAVVSAQNAPPTGSDPQNFPDIVARINATEISKTQLLRRARALKSQIPPSEAGEGFYHRVLDDMVNGELMYLAVETEGLVPADAEVDAKLDSQQERFGGPAAFASALEEQGLTIDEIKLEIKKELGIQKLVERDFIPQVAVTEAEKKAFYDENQAEMQQPVEFKAAHILISVDESATPEKKAELKKKAESIRNMLEMGQDFVELAAKNSGDPGSKNNGGELGWMPEGQTVPPFEAAMKSLEPGELSELVETRFGYHIIKLQDRRGAGAIPYAEVDERIEEFLKQRGLQERIQHELELLRGTATVEVFI